MTSPRHEKLLSELAELKLHRIAEVYQEILNEAARKGSSMLDVLAVLIGEEVAVRRQRALERRLHHAKLPQRKTLQEYDFNFPKRIPKQAIVRLFDGDFVAQHGCAIFIGPTGTGKSHLLVALGYTACEKGITVRFTRVVDMINVLTTAQLNGTLEKKLRQYTTPQLLLLDELGYLPIDKRLALRRPYPLAGPELPTLRSHGPSLAPRSQVRLHGKSAPRAASDPRLAPSRGEQARPGSEGTAAAQASALHADIDATAGPARPQTRQPSPPTHNAPRPWLRAELGGSTRSARLTSPPNPQCGPQVARNHGRPLARSH